MTNLTRLIIAIAFFMLALSAHGQNYIGLHKDEIREKVRQELQGFVFTKEIFNYDRSFVKFENSFEEQTLIFMLNTDGYCTSVSRMYNSWLYNRLKIEMENKYGKSKTLIWTETKDGKEFEVELRRGEWFITIVTRVKR